MSWHKRFVDQLVKAACGRQAQLVVVWVVSQSPKCQPRRRPPRKRRVRYAGKYYVWPGKQGQKEAA
jgi:hypothetical protein